MAKKVARGVESVDGCEAVIRSVPKVSSNLNATAKPVPGTGAPYVQLEDLATHDGLILGSPTHFGNMSASIKHFIDQSSAQWLSGDLNGKPAAAFTSTGSLHGGQEATLLTMLIPLLHHGMVISGLPYTHPGLMKTKAGGTPYGASHFAGESGDNPLQETEEALCLLLGERVATLAIKLAN
ncbi:UNVERIFIED_CONTAM: hypothetical protein GTU68_027719 [Idotea baltica]|nr:hypothetical protein [Idotea baltica]